MNHDIAHIRRDYQLQALTEQDAATNPFDQFTKWWHEVLNAQIDEVNAMILSTADASGKPHARVVLLKGYDANGFIFFTNYNSHKGKQISENPFASILFFWKELERQVRIEGTIQQIDATQSDAYFNSRPAGSRIGAWASPQSSVIPDRKLIEQNFLDYEEKFGTENIPRPQHWGGYIVQPNLFEFWQGRSSRLHDRLQYRLANNEWILERLAP